MNGAEALVGSLVACEVDTWFANPGTTEMQLVAALDTVPGTRAVLGLFEGVCTGAADGYGRMLDRPAATLLHLGPGFANGIANLHNARRAHSPVVNVVGDHATWHVDADAPLTSDIESLARPVSQWVRTAGPDRPLAVAAADAVRAALGPPAGVATLVVPQDLAWGDANGPVPERPVTRVPEPPDPDTVRDAVEALRQPGALLYLGGRALRGRGQVAAKRIAIATSCRVMTETFPARVERIGKPVDAVPYFPEQATAALADVTVAVLAGAGEPVAFFGYSGQRSRLLPDGARRLTLAGPPDDVEAALEAVAEEVGGPVQSQPLAQPGVPLQLPSGSILDANVLGQAVAALQPEGAIVVNEGATSGLPWAAASAGAPPHTVLGLTGGAIGQGLPCAVGAAVACPDRRVIALQADGSGMYTLQALWTMAREALDVTVVVCANRAYRILQYELFRAGVGEPGPNAASLTDLHRPTLDWVALGRGMGVPAARAESADALVGELQRALATPGPALIEAVLG